MTRLEHISRRLCEESGLNPDAKIIAGDNVGEALWIAYRRLAELEWLKLLQQPMSESKDHGDFVG